MSRAERALVLLLRAAGLLTLTALFPAVMPRAWMDAIHRWLGLGALHQAPIVGYLTRSLSAMYALHGALVLFVSTDVRRWMPVIRCLAVLGVLFGAGMIVLDWAVGLPAWWIAGEGPVVIALGVAILWLASQVTARKEKPVMEIEVRKPTPEEEAQMTSWPTWEKEPSEFPWHYDQKETCLILEGEVTIEAPDQTVSFGPGDLVVFPQGLDCTWKIAKEVRKHYQFG